MTTGKKVDLENLIDRWARDYFDRNVPSKEKKLMKQGLVALEIDWKRVKFVHDEAEYSPAPPAPGKGTPTNNVLFNTSFTNHTEYPQKYTFRTQRTTRSSCTIAVEQGYVTGVEMNVKLSTPCEILELNAGFKRETALTNAEGQTVEEELTWGVDCEVEVKAHHAGEAKLIILEEEYKGGFEVKTHISGIARVIFTNLKNNNSFMKAIERPVVDIVKEAIADQWIQPSEAFSIDGNTNTILSRTKGKCHFRFGVKQVVEVDEKAIS